MKTLMTYSLQKIVTQALTICFLAIILPIMTHAQDYPDATGGMDATVVYYKFGEGPRGQGELRLISQKEWSHIHATGYQGVYNETRRDQWSVYMTKENATSIMEITINLWLKTVTRKITKKTGNKEVSTTELGKITRAIAARADLAIQAEEAAANRAYKLTQPVVDEDLNAIMMWIGQETSRQSVTFCWKDTYPRKNYNSKAECESAESAECEKLLSWWYVKCKEGYETSTVPNCLMKCPKFDGNGLGGAQNVKVDCGLVCGLNSDACAEGISEMVFAPIMMALNIVSFGLTGLAKNTAKNAALGGAAATNAGVTKTALAAPEWTKLLKALEASEEIVSPAIDAKDQLEYLYNTVQDLETEINRWNEFYDSEFDELTHYTVNAMINNRFPDPDDRSYIKRAYGQYQLTAMTEADGWRIAKAVLAAASIEPLGIVATINAFAHPVCNPVPYPFPDIRIIPKNERYKVYPKVHFHLENNLTFEQAKAKAKSSSWTLASETEIRNAWNVGQLDVYAFGMLSNGKFAVPVQSNHSNFQKGPNIGAVGGNQGFFYTVGLHEVVLPPAATPLPLVSNTRPQGYESSTPVVPTVQPGAITNVALGKSAKQSSSWANGAGKTFPANIAVDGVKEGFGNISHTLQEAGAWWEVDLGNSYNISSIKVYNAADIPQRMNDFTILVSETPFTGNSGGTAFVANQPAPTPTQSYSGNTTGRYVRLFLNGTNYLTIHEIEIFGTPTPASPAAGPITPLGDGFVRIQNSWYKDNYINNQKGKIEQGPIQPNWWSAQWKIVPAHSGWVRIQNRWYPDQYLHNQNGKLEVGKIQDNWASALWKLVPAHSGWVRIQNSWYKDHYIHNQNGKIELGPIQNNWASAIWKVE